MLAVVPTTGAEYLSPREAESITAVRCIKRNGKAVPFDPDRILTAVRKCFASCGSKLDADDQRRTSEAVTRRVVRQTLARKVTEVGVEQVQDAVIAQLWGEGLTDEATHYSNYREERRKARLNKPVSEATRQRFEEMKEHFPTDIQAYQFMSKFSRWRESDKRRETWRETVFERVMPWFRRVLVKYGCELADAEWSMLEDSMYHLQAGPAMRVVQMAGPALDRCEMGAYNCLSRDTRFVTEAGVRSFEDFEDGDLVTVLSHTGRWRSAVVRKYGTRPLSTVVMRRGSARVEVKATDNHRWLLRDGTVTENLKVGDQLITPPTPFADWDYDTAEPDEKLFWAYGFTFGDGTLTKKGGEYRYSMVRLCGDKVKYLERFTELGFSHSLPPSQDGEPTVYTGRYLKSLPDLEADGLRKTMAFVRGWLDADGSKNPNPSPNRFTNLQVTGEDKVAFVRSVFPAVGVYITSEQDVTDRETNYGQRTGTTVRFGISQHFGSSKNQSAYSVIDIRPADQEEVWCLEVDEDASFVLPTGAVTGNCTAMPIVDLKCFPEMLYILMQGCGVGFSVESEFVDQLPPLKKQRGEPPVTIVVEDHTEGWCDALYEALLLWWDGYDVYLDVSKVRAAGTRLKTKGGRASGPGPLLELFAFIRNLVMARQGKRLRDVDAHRLCCFIGRIVQVGGVRRAATISLSDLDSLGMRDVKSGNWWADTTYWSDGRYLSMANNSAVYEEKPDIETFMAEWLALVKSKSGERGIFNRQAAELHKPARRKGLQRWLVNPCAEIILRPFGSCVSGETPLITRDGLVRIGEVENEQVEVWNGKRWSEVTVRKTGTDQQLVRVTFSDGSRLDCTPDHRFSVNTADSRFKKGENVWQEVYAKDLKPRMATETFCISHTGGEPLKNAYTLGVLLGDGTVDREYACVDLYGDKISLPVVGRRGPEVLKPGYGVPCVRVNTGGDQIERLQALRADNPDCWDYLFTRDRASLLDFLAGWFDTDGSNTDSGGVRLYVSGRFKADMVQLLLTKCGIRSSINLMSRTGDETNFGKRSADVWYVQVTDCGELPCHRLDVSGGHAATMKGKYQTVRSVEYLPGRHDTFCFTEPEQHKGVFNNTLTYQCNLSIAIARANDDRESLKHKVRVATYFGVMQSLCTDFKYVREEWKKNCEEERLLGVDITGHADCPLLRFGAPGRAELLKELKAEVDATAKMLSERFGINYSAANTCVKPSGDSAVFFDCASGVSPRFAAEQVRWVRESKDSPVARYLTDAGVPNAPAPEAPDSLKVFGFPRKAPAGSTTREQMTALDQLNNWLEWKTCWAEHSVSATIYVDEHEWLETGAWVYEHFSHITGLSFLPRDNGTYVYAPNEQLTPEQYAEWEENFPTLDWSKLTRYEDDDQTEVTGTVACANGVCGF